jgi:hypothetical protein
MPKILDYPNSSFKNSIDMAEAISALGGKCDKETCASQMGLKFSGAFINRIGAAVKFNLISTGKGYLMTTDLFSSIKNAYTPEEEKKFKTEAFLSPPVFNELYNRFKGKKIPVEILDKLLIREYDVKESVASIVAKYFKGGAKFVGLLDETNTLSSGAISEDTDQSSIETTEDNSPESSNQDILPTTLEQNIQLGSVNLASEENQFIVHISGPGMDSKLVIKEEEDLFIVEAMLKKVKSKL